MTTARARGLARVIGHRGAAARAPENTLAGLRRARELGATWVEFDVKLTADGVPILMHDETLDRTTNGRGPVSARSWNEVARLDAGSWFGPEFAGERVPPLNEVLALLGALGLGANIEIKPCPGRAAETGRVVAAAVREEWPPHLAPPLLSSFWPEALRAAQAVAPDLPRGLLVREPPAGWHAWLESLGCAGLHASHRALTPDLCAAVKAVGFLLLAYTVNDPRRARQLWSWGVDAVFSDAPELLLPAAAL